MGRFGPDIAYLWKKTAIAARGQVSKQACGFPDRVILIITQSFFRQNVKNTVQVHPLT